MDPIRNNILVNYEQHAQNKQHRLQRQAQRTYELKAFNNWIKAVLIQTQSKYMCRQVQETLDIKRGDSPLLHVLDIGCGRGQDIAKWKLARISYMVCLDFSPECIRSYEQRWRTLKQPYRLYSIVGDFTSKTLYSQLQHSFYDIVSAQFCFHYMLGSEAGLNFGLGSILSNLLIGGVFIATIPDSYSILKKVNEKGIQQSDGSRVYGNKYFSMRFETTQFKTPYNNMYGFYLEGAVGSKDSEGKITYTNQWLIQLDSLSKSLQKFGVQIEETMNFLQYYLKYREDYKELFPKFKLIYAAGQSIDPQLWEIAHLYRVLICKKKAKGKTIKEFNQKKRMESIGIKQVRGSFNRQSAGHRGGSFSRQNTGYRGYNSGNRNHSSGHGYQPREGDYSRSRDKPNNPRQFKRHNN